MRSAGAGCRLQTCRRGDPQRFNSAFPAICVAFAKSARSAGFEPARAEPTGFQVQPRDHLGTIARHAIVSWLHNSWIRAAGNRGLVA